MEPLVKIGKENNFCLQQQAPDFDHSAESDKTNIFAKNYKKNISLNTNECKTEFKGEMRSSKNELPTPIQSKETSNAAISKDVEPKIQEDEEDEFTSALEEFGNADLINEQGTTKIVKGANIEEVGAIAEEENILIVKPANEVIASLILNLKNDFVFSGNNPKEAIEKGDFKNICEVKDLNLANRFHIDPIKREIAVPQGSPLKLNSKLTINGIEYTVRRETEDERKQFNTNWNRYTTALQKNAPVISDEKKSDKPKHKITPPLNLDSEIQNIQGTAEISEAIRKDAKKADENRKIEGERTQTTQEKDSKLDEEIKDEEEEKRINKEDIVYKIVHKEIIQTNSEVQSKNNIILIFESLKNPINQPTQHTVIRLSSRIN